MDLSFASLHLVDALLVALGDLLLLSVLFFVLRVRSPLLRRTLFGLAILNSCAALFHLSPYHLLSIDLAHDGAAAWYGPAATIDRVVFFSWLAVAMTLCVVRVIRARRAQHLLWCVVRLQSGASGRAPHPLEVRLQDVARTMKVRAPRLLLLEELCSPFVVGLRDPILVFPERLQDFLSESELDAIFAHELAHVRRFDTWIHPALELVRAIQFFNLPLLRLISLYKDEVEKMRDQEASRRIGSPRPLASGLLKVLRRSVGQRVGPPSWLGHSTLVPPSARRIESRLRNLNRRSRRSWLLLTQVLVLLLIVPAPLQRDRSVTLRQVPSIPSSEHHSQLSVGLWWSGGPFQRQLMKALAR